MEWLSGVRKQAQDALSTALHSDAAERARALAAQASQQASVLAKEARNKAQEVAKEALGEAERGIASLRAQARAPPGSGIPQPSLPPASLGVTPQLEQFARSLTYSTFSDYPMDSLQLPEDEAQQRLDAWQLAHARAILGAVPQLQDLRFVMCPRRMPEFTFWAIYYQLADRFLPPPEQRCLPSLTAQQQQQLQPPPQQQLQPPPQQQLQPPPQQQQQQTAQPSRGHDDRGISSATAAAVTVGELPLSTSAPVMSSEQHNPDAAAGDAAAGTTAVAASAVDAAEAAADESGALSSKSASAGMVSAPAAPRDSLDDALAALADDAELDAYLQDALRLDGGCNGEEHAQGGGGGGGDNDDDELADLDEYISKLDAEVAAAQPPQQQQPAAEQKV